jgi:hypothetical protein
VTFQGIVGGIMVMAGAWLGALSPQSRGRSPVRGIEPRGAALDTG